jgi:hypothetical protein
MQSEQNYRRLRHDALQNGGRFDAAHARHRHVEKNQIWLRLLRTFYALHTILRFTTNDIASRFEVEPHQVSNGGVVVNDEEPRHEVSPAMTDLNWILQYSDLCIDWFVGRAVTITTTHHNPGPSICTKSFAGFGGGAAVFHRAGGLGRLRTRFDSVPTPTEAPTKWSTRSGPATFTVRIQCNPLLMAQPHWEQSGVPPKTQGSTGVSKSAE